MSIGIAVITHQRPEVFAECLDSVLTHSYHEVIAVVDGDDTGYDGALSWLDTWAHIAPGGNVARAKNLALEMMLDAGHEHLFLIEDDMRIKSLDIWDGYINAAPPYEHLSFGHGALNLEPIRIDDKRAYWPNYSGGVSYFTKNAISCAGLMEERMVNAYEHVEHTLRLGELGLHTKWGEGMADAKDSRDWIEQIDTHSVAGQNSHPIDAIKVWREIAPETANKVFGAG